jgi:HAD superfamily hydrolase (TIGR01509 family)
MVEQLIFDCDGVLVDSEIIAARVMVEMLNEHRIPITISYYLQHCTGKTFSGLASSLGRKFDKTLPADFVQLVTAQMEATSSKHLQPIDGMEQMLTEIACIPKAVVSNSELHQIKSSLDKVNISSHFGAHTFSSEQVAKPKPSPLVYLHAADILGVKPAACLVVEDSVSGATAALTAGMQVIGFLAGSHIVAGHEERLRAVGVRQMADSSLALKEIIEKAF